MRIVLVLALLALTACAARPPLNLDERGGIRSEKETIGALRRIGATDEQRRAVLAAFDRARPDWRALQAERELLQHELGRLPPKAPGYLEQADALAQRWGTLHQREVEVFARYEQAVAGALSEEQWSLWRIETAERKFVERRADEGEVRRRR
jgi:hypothetical protein